MAVDETQRIHDRIEELRHEMRECERRLAAAGDVSSPAIEGVARRMLAHRATLGRYVEAPVFADPALDMLLFLFARHEDGLEATTSDCCAAARVPRSTALRWVQLLKAHGLVVAEADPWDRRVTLLSLTDLGRAQFGGWLRHDPSAPQP